jgi:hypothetical protein
MGVHALSNFFFTHDTMCPSLRAIFDINDCGSKGEEFDHHPGLGKSDAIFSVRQSVLVVDQSC